MSEPPSRVLKSSLHRSVRLIEEANGARTVVKRFQSRSLAGATLDRARAAREHRMLTALHALGVAVPRPLALERVGGAWEVHMQWIDEALTPADVLAGGASWPHSPERAARTLGSLLAELHAAGVDHPDLHPGNALLTRDGAAWAIDFHKARRVARLAQRKIERDLVRLAASVRERTTPTFRARFFLAWWRALPRELRPALARAEWVREIEHLARAERVHYVKQRRARWTRQGTACDAVEREFSGFVARGVELVRALELDSVARQRAAGPCAELAGSATLLVTGLSARETRRVWWCAARLCEHGLAAASPLAVAFDPRPWVALSVPPGARAGVNPSAMRERRALRSLGRLCAALADRALKPSAAAGALFWLDARGQVFLGPALDLVHEKRAAGGVDTTLALALAGLSLFELSRPQRAAFALGLLEGARLSPRARDALRNELRHG
ncbi:MAG: hypothetical protein IT454_19445 [Planctomycetes bacterium]|nr:hypothetical protein [Planctomycetota bacterium]